MLSKCNVYASVCGCYLYTISDSALDRDEPMDDMTVEIHNFTSCAESFCPDHQAEDQGVSVGLFRKITELLPEAYATFDEYERYCPAALKAALPTLNHFSPGPSDQQLPPTTAAPMAFTLSIRTKENSEEKTSVTGATLVTRPQQKLAGREPVSPENDGVTAVEPITNHYVTRPTPEPALRAGQAHKTMVLAHRGKPLALLEHSDQHAAQSEPIGGDDPAMELEGYVRPKPVFLTKEGRLWW